MGYAIFTARKLMLTNRVNQLNFRIMQLSQQQQTLANNAANMERSMASMKNLFSNIGNIFQMGMTMQQNAVSYALIQKLQSTNGDFKNSEIEAGLKSMIGTCLGGGANFFTTGLGMQLQVMNQAMETVNQTKLQQIKDMENQIELQRKSLETQLAAAQEELKAVEKAEEKQIESSAPKFA